MAFGCIGGVALKSNNKMLLKLRKLRYWYYVGWGLLNQFSLFRYFQNISAFSKHTLAIEYHVYIWQLLPPQIKYECDLNNLRGKFARSKILHMEKLTNRTLVTPIPGPSACTVCVILWKINNGSVALVTYIHGVSNVSMPTSAEWLCIHYSPREVM